MPHQVQPIPREHTVYAAQYTVPWFAGIRNGNSVGMFVDANISHEDRNKSI